jgi:hypothetical protein
MIRSRLLKVDNGFDNTIRSLAKELNSKTSYRYRGNQKVTLVNLTAKIGRLIETNKQDVMDYLMKENADFNRRKRGRGFFDFRM